MFSFGRLVELSQNVKKKMPLQTHFLSEWACYLMPGKFESLSLVASIVSSQRIGSSFFFGFIVLFRVTMRAAGISLSESAALLVGE